MNSINQQFFQIYLYSEVANLPPPKAGQLVIVTRTPDFEDTHILLITDGQKTIGQLYSQWKEKQIGNMAIEFNSYTAFDTDLSLPPPPVNGIHIGSFKITALNYALRYIRAPSQAGNYEVLLFAVENRFNSAYNTSVNNLDTADTGFQRCAAGAVIYSLTPGTQLKGIFIIRKQA
jgi:hypothetical protein